MALGTYGITRPADMSPEDVEIIMIYTPSRDYTAEPVIKKLNASQILTPYFNNSNTHFFLLSISILFISLSQVLYFDKM
jgi:hypothetical protein